MCSWDYDATCADCTEPNTNGGSYEYVLYACIPGDFSQEGDDTVFECESVTWHDDNSNTPICDLTECTFVIVVSIHMRERGREIQCCSSISRFSSLTRLHRDADDDRILLGKETTSDDAMMMWCVCVCVCVCDSATLITTRSIEFF